MLDIEHGASSAQGIARRPRDGGGPSPSIERLERRFGPSLELLVRRPAAPARGAPVLFLHGALAGAWCWEESWLRAVAETGRHAAAVSLRGHGGSDGRSDVWRAGLADFAADLRLAIEAMPEPPVLAAHSVGGLLAQQLLGQTAPGCVSLRGLVLVGSLPPEGLALLGPWLGWSSWSNALFRPAALAWPAELGFARSFEDPQAMFGVGIRPASAAAYTIRMGEGAPVSLAQAHLPQPVPPACLVGLPTLVLHGSRDRLVDATTAWRTAFYHGAAFASVAGAGHFPMLGPHAEAGAQALCRWLSEQRL